ncbi:unnamed protein product, partial [Chrysoparadoxa australica]
RLKRSSGWKGASAMASVREVLAPLFSQPNSFSALIRELFAAFEASFSEASNLVVIAVPEQGERWSDALAAGIAAEARAGYLCLEAINAADIETGGEHD